MSHDSRTREARRLQTRQLTLVIALSAGTLLVEVGGGVLSGSLALLSDAGHVLSALLAPVLRALARCGGGRSAWAPAGGPWRLGRGGGEVLLEPPPAGIDLDGVSRAIATVPGVVEVHDLHIWSITTGLPALSGHVRLDGAQPHT